VSREEKFFPGYPNPEKIDPKTTIDLFSFRAPTEILIYELFTVR
jgi:hypothetical protein